MDFDKKIYASGIAIAMAGISSVAIFADNQSIRTNHAVNLRSGAGMKYKVIDVIPNDTEVSLIGKSGGWYKVTYKGKTGYSYKDFFDVKEDAKSEKTGVVQVGSSRLNVRKDPSTKGAIIGKLYTNTKVTILDETQNWYKIKYKNTTGFVSKTYIKTGNVTPTTPTTKKLTTRVNSNVRSGPSTDYRIIGYLPKGSTVTKKAQCSNKWYQIDYKGKTAYISYKCVDEESDKKTDDNDKVNGKVKVNTNSNRSLNMRTGPSTFYKVIGSIKNDTVLDILSKEGNWTKVKYKDMIGYCYSRYLQVVK